MATGVGLRIAEDVCTASIVSDTDEPRYIVRESVLHMSEDGDTVLGGPKPEGYGHSVTGFVQAIGDPTGITVDDGEAYRPEDLVATALYCLINLTADQLAGSAEFFAAHPASWPAEYVQSLREAMDYLGLRSVVLINEGDLPSNTDPLAALGAGGAADIGQSVAYDAARAALASVLATPAGATPPDPSTAENSTIDTVVFPAVNTERPQAYSAAIPVAGPATEAVTVAGVPEVHPAEPTPAPTPRKGRRTPFLIGIAAAIGLALGAFGVAMVLRARHETPAPPIRDARSEISVTPTPAPPPPPPTTTVEPTTTTQPPRVWTPDPTTTVEPPPPPPPPPTTTTPPPTTTTTPPPTTTRYRPPTTTRYPRPPMTFEPWPELPGAPPFPIPGMG
ncbi:hypothetical protein D5S18_10910 [Nocardia panacis]|uniref:Uncharacterized protein n=1 Tax=Nocardia panacis TaxID=2340916 RepID=A0A3A4K6P5_9NOCA|nr:hypothetical protein [Nocardia panacis]RJO76759.1 hypothetical protein D5S18_10910 [Nocardia panacis]